MLENLKNAKQREVKIMKYHLCCNQLESCWEVRDSKESVIFSGTLSQANNYLEKNNQLNEVKI